MYCINCGNKVDPADIVCSACGTPVVGAGRSASSDAENQTGAEQQSGGCQNGSYQNGGYQTDSYQYGNYQSGGYQGGYQSGGSQNGYQPGGYQYGNYQSGGYRSGYDPAGAAVPLKSRTAAGILGILLGSLGVHNFYLGFTSRAVAQLLISVLSCFVLSPVSGIWGLVEGIQYLTGEKNVDGRNMPLK